VVTPVGDGVYRVEIGGRSEIVYVAGTVGDLWAFWNGEIFRQRDYELRPAMLPSNPAALQPVTAPMPGTVLKILVQPGARVAQGDTLLILEAMKMELPLRSPDAAVITAVRCHEGELVQADAPLVELTRDGT
jgi:3-methylcrotonyl-CoA carboxylase alpha subunit